MSDKQRSELYSFISLMFVRVPAYREFIDKYAAELMKRKAQDRAQDKEEFGRSVKAYEAATGESLGDVDKLREFAASGNYTVSQRSSG